MNQLIIKTKNGFIDMQDLPHNCIFNKKITGCGATTIALYNEENYVIAVPTTELITNKTGRTTAGRSTISRFDGMVTRDVFGLFGEFDNDVKKELREYLAAGGTRKVVCTYDKLRYLVSYLDGSDFRLLVDEYHVLLKAYTYRNEAIEGVFGNFRKFKSFCFVSATPISVDFVPNALKDIDIVEAVWPETDRLLVKMDMTDKPYLKAANYIRDFMKDGELMINGMPCHELFFFLNSVTDIVKILNHCKLNPKDVKIVCANTLKNQLKLKQYKISNSRSENKPVTFITSKSFEGVDYFSDTGMCFVVSNTVNKFTLLDISTDIFQIAGRIRTESNPFRNTIIHIFNTMGKRELNFDKTYDQLMDEIKEEALGAQEALQALNNSELARKFGNKIANTSPYLIKGANGLLEYNDMVVKLQMFIYRIEQKVYRDGVEIKKEYHRNNADTTPIEYEKREDKMKGIKIRPFKEVFLELCDVRDDFRKRHLIRFADEFDLDRRSMPMLYEDILAIEQPLVRKAYDMLGPDEVRRLKYLKASVEEAIDNLQHDKSNEARMAKLVTSRIKPGFIPSRQAKKIIGDCYEALEISKKPKASDLENWFKCKLAYKWIDNKSIQGYEIYMSRIVQKQ